MDIRDVIWVEDMIIDLRPDGRTKLLKELAVHAAYRTGCSAAEIILLLLTREKLGSAGIG